MNRVNIRGGTGFVANELCLDFANTAGWHASDHPREHLRGYDDLLRWAIKAELIGSEEVQRLEMQASHNPKHAATALAKAITIREVLYRLFTAIAKGEKVSPVDIDLLNGELAAAPAQLQMKAKDNGFIAEWKVPEAGLLGFLAPVVWSAADLLSSMRLQWVKQCAGDPCGWLFVDTTRNHSRRWCDMNDCGSRAKAKRFYYRHKTKS